MSSVKEDGEAGDEHVAKASTPLLQSIDRAEDIGAMLLDEAYEPSNTRLREIGIMSELHPDIGSDDLISMGQVIFAEGGGSLRTYSGGLNHVCGWWPSWKRRRLQHWEGIPAYYHLLAAECDFDVDWMQSEGIGFRFYLDRKWRGYTADADMWIAGRRHVVEIKRTERDLQDSDYRLKLAAVAEICRRCGWIFRIVLADEIFANRHHRENCERFAMRRMATVAPRHIDRLENFAVRNGPESTYWDVAAALAPTCIEAGEAILQALTIRRRVRIDLTRRVHAQTPILIL